MEFRDRYSEFADRFGTVAKEFCSAVDSASRVDRLTLLTEVYKVLPTLINEAIRLPATELSDDDVTEENGKSLSHPRTRLTDEQWQQLYSLLKEKLGDWDLYFLNVTPTTDKEAVCGSLADDMADIYRDVKEGLVLKEMHLAQPEDVIWNWRLLYCSHWGKHAIDALLTIHFRLQQAPEC